jgi:hypothetical protein
LTASARGIAFVLTLLLSGTVLRERSGAGGINIYIFFSMARQPYMGLGLLVSSRLHDHTVRHTTVGRTPLDEGPARRRDLYLTHNTHKRQTSMPPVGFEPTIPASERPKTHALDRTATGIGYIYIYIYI